MNKINRRFILALGMMAGIIALLSVAGCSKKQEPKSPRQQLEQEVSPENVPPSSATSLTDEEWLLLPDYLPLGETYDQVKGRFVALGPSGPAGGLQMMAEQGMTEASMPVNVLDHDETMQFNFRHDSLYAFYYTTGKLDTTSATDLWGYLNDFYTQHFGVSREEADSEAAYYLESSMWYTDAFDVVLSLRLERAGPATVSWGFQETKGK